MKKTTLLFVFVLAVLVSANAQLGLGIKGGLNFANTDAGEAFDNLDGKTGYHFGAFVEIGGGNVALQPEVLFSTKGADDFDLSYLEIPVLVKFKFLKILNVHLGPQFGILTKAERNNDDVKDYIKSSDIGGVIGAGVNLPLGFVGGVRYVYDFNDDNDSLSDYDNQIQNSDELKNRTFQLYVGWKLF